MVDHTLTWYVATISGGLAHAGRREACPFGPQFADDTERARWYADNDANHPDYGGVYTVRLLCRRGGGQNVPVVRRKPFSALLSGVCSDCARLHVALYTPPVTGWDRPCKTCEELLPVNYFATHKGHRDGLADECTPCGMERRWRTAQERR